MCPAMGDALAQLWAKADTFEAIRRRTLKEKCLCCRHGVACGGCRGWAKRLTGDKLGTDYSCWHAHTILTPEDVQDWA